TRRGTREGDRPGTRRGRRRLRKSNPGSRPPGPPVRSRRWGPWPRGARGARLSARRSSAQQPLPAPEEGEERPDVGGVGPDLDLVHAEPAEEAAERRPLPGHQPGEERLERRDSCVAGTPVAGLVVRDIDLL